MLKDYNNIYLEKEHLNSVVGFVHTANKAIIIAQDRATQASQDCQQLEKSIDSLIVEKEKLVVELVRVKQENAQEEKCRGEYRKKMAAYKEKVSRSEDTSPVSIELRELQEKISMLMEKSEYESHNI